MNNVELEAIRRLLFLTTAEAGRNVAIDETHPNGVSECTWNRWEKGVKPIPERIERQLKLLLSRREAEIQRITQNAQAGAPLFALWYHSRHDCPPFFARETDEPSVVDKKLSQSIASAIAAQGGRVVPFDAEKFNAWQAQNSFAGDVRAAHERWAMDEYFKAALPLCPNL